MNLLGVVGLLSAAVMLLGVGWAQPTQPLRPTDVVVLYNSAEQRSRNLATFYAEQRGIPQGNLVGLDMPLEETIRRDAFTSEILRPLQRVFSERAWWQLGEIDGMSAAMRTNKRVIAVMHGVPLKVARSEDGGGGAGADEASVDSELAVLGLLEAKIEGQVRNLYFEEDESFRAMQLAPFFLVGRIQGTSYGHSRRMIEDAIAVERRGLWGHVYVDQDDQYPQGTQWLDAVAERSLEWGFPMVIEPTTNGFASHYPMEHCALYYGWYSHHYNGALRNPNFTFEQGAIAVAIHSFSARTIVPNRHWCGPILARGAAATLGNVYEPYLGMTHHLDVFHDRLLKGYSFVEAAHMSLRACSWMWVNLGDPLYRPFAFQNQMDETDYRVNDVYQPWRVLRWLALQQPDQQQRIALISRAGQELDSFVYYEAAAMLAASHEQVDEAREYLDAAANAALSPQDKMRNYLNISFMAELLGNEELAHRQYLQIADFFSEIPEARAARGMAERLRPPSPEVDGE